MASAFNSVSPSDGYSNSSNQPQLPLSTFASSGSSVFGAASKGGSLSVNTDATVPQPGVFRASAFSSARASAPTVVASPFSQPTSQTRKSLFSSGAAFQPAEHSQSAEQLPVVSERAIKAREPSVDVEQKVSVFSQPSLGKNVVSQPFVNKTQTEESKSAPFAPRINLSQSTIQRERFNSFQPSPFPSASSNVMRDTQQPQESLITSKNETPVSQISPDFAEVAMQPSMPSPLPNKSLINAFRQFLLAISNADEAAACKIFDGFCHSPDLCASIDDVTANTELGALCECFEERKSRGSGRVNLQDSRRWIPLCFLAARVNALEERIMHADNRFWYKDLVSACELANVLLSQFVDFFREQVMFSRETAPVPNFLGSVPLSLVLVVVERYISIFRRATAAHVSNVEYTVGALRPLCSDLAPRANAASGSSERGGNQKSSAFFAYALVQSLLRDKSGQWEIFAQCARKLHTVYRSNIPLRLHFLFLQGRDALSSGRYTEAFDFFVQALTLCPYSAGSSRRLLFLNATTAALALGKVPEKTLARTAQLKLSSAPLLALAQALKEGSLEQYELVVSNNRPYFVEYGFFAAVADTRLRIAVVKLARFCRAVARGRALKELRWPFAELVSAVVCSDKGFEAWNRRFEEWKNSQNINNDLLIDIIDDGLLDFAVIPSIITVENTGNDFFEAAFTELKPMFVHRHCVGSIDLNKGEVIIESIKWSENR